MRRRFVLLLATALAVVAVVRMRAVTPPASTTPVVLELFTSEGCSSCPAADRLLQSLVDAQPIAGAELIGLGVHVDYWDQQGWKDRFSSAASTERQRRYGQIFNIDSIYTPQLVVDGREEMVGSDAGAARRAVLKAIASPHAAVRLTSEPSGTNRLAVGVAVDDLPKLSRGDRADIVVAVTESQLRTEVRAGENRGRTLAHAPVVRQMTTIGEVSDARSVAKGDVALAPTWQRDHLRIVAFVQERFSRRVLGAAAQGLASPPR